MIDETRPGMYVLIVPATSRRQGKAIRKMGRVNQSIDQSRAGETIKDC